LQNFNNFQKKIAFISINKYIGNGHETHHFWTFCGLFKVKGCTHTKGRQHNQPQQYVTLCQTSNFLAPKWKRLKFTSWVARLGKASECGGVNPGYGIQTIYQCIFHWICSGGTCAIRYLSIPTSSNIRQTFMFPKYCLHILC
jgi:hypothetical protein